MGTSEFVDIETARNARGLRLVTPQGIPSPWSMAAKAIFEYKRIPTLIVSKSARDEAVQSWTGIGNVPVVVHENEPPLSGWAEILMLAERLAPEPSLVPREPDTRVTMFGLSHEVLGAGGVMYNIRLMTIDAGIESNGERGFPTQVSQYLGVRYGHTQGCGARARAAAIQQLQLVGERLQHARSQGHHFYLGEKPTALDFYSAAVVDSLVMLPQELCAARPVFRAALTWAKSELADAIPAVLVEHRDHLHATHWPLPLELGSPPSSTR
jgi:glutathione S-transferase